MSNYFIEIENKDLNQKVVYFYNGKEKKIVAQKLVESGVEIILDSENKSENLQPQEKIVFHYFLEVKENISFDDLDQLFLEKLSKNLEVEGLKGIMSNLTKKFKSLTHTKLKEFNQSLNSKFLFNYDKKAAVNGHLNFRGDDGSIKIKKVGNFEENKMLKSVYEQNQKYESSVTHSELMSVLLEKSKLLSKMLFKTTSGDFLPFIKINQRIHFPLLIDNDNMSVPHNWTDSYKKQRERLGARMYDGANFRALNIQDNQLIIGKSSYFNVLDSADYISSRLKIYHKQPNIGEFERVFKIWQDRLRNIHERHDFSSFNSGIAFSMPVFKVCQDDSLKVLAAKNSQYKANGSGKRHVSPAGMLEYFFKTKDTHFSFADIKTLFAKELLEETVFGENALQVSPNHPFRSILTPFFDTPSLPNQDNVTFTALMSFVQVIHDNWQEIWHSFGKEGDEVPNHAALSAVLKMTEMDFYKNSYLVVDFANLRPEFIVPIYIHEPLNEMVNWEYEKENKLEAIKKDILLFKDLEDLNKWAKNEVDEYCAPALAAIYLGAKQFFELNDRL